LALAKTISLVALLMIAVIFSQHLSPS